MKRILALWIALITVVCLILGGCGTAEVDRSKELQSAMKSNDMELSAAFLENASSFSEVSEFIKEWALNAGLEIAADKDHYVTLRNPATEGWDDKPATTLQIHVDPMHIRRDIDLLSMAMAACLGPEEHGIIRLMITENDQYDLFEGAHTVKKKNITDRHFIHMEMGNSAMVYTSGAMGMSARLHCDAPRKEPEYTKAYRISFTIPEHAGPYSYDKASNYPNPIETIGNLLASAKSAGRLFEIASFSSQAEEGFLPHSATAVIVIDDNNVENFMKRFDSSYESIDKKFKEIVKEQEKEKKSSSTEDSGPLFTYTIAETDPPANVLRQKGSDNIISLMYTLETGIVSQNEESGEIESVSYIQNISTSNGKFALDVRMRGLDEESIREISDRYLVTSGLCDVAYTPTKATRIWSSKADGRLSDFFFRAVNLEKEASPINLSRTECDILGNRGENLDMIFYRVNKDHRNTAIKNILAYLAGEDVPE